jgi:thymidylate synthase (FAD)
MFLIRPSYEILAHSASPNELIERAGRTCYKSEDKITQNSARNFVEMISKRGHLSVIEHASMTVKFIIDRGVSHELVRHRLASYSQESTRYVNYYKKGQITYIIPPWIDIKEGEYTFPYTEENPWIISLLECEDHYNELIKIGWKPEQARSVLPNSLKTEIVMTANFREWSHVFKLRCSDAAHPQMREIMIPLQKECQKHWPEIFRKD